MKRMEQREQTASEERKGILSLPPEERPYEKCLEQGCQALSDAELLAVIIRTGAVGDTSVDLARRVLDLGGRQGNLAGLCGLSVQELTSVKGIGRVKAIQIQCIAELSRRMAKSRARDGLCFHDPASIADFYMEDLRHEEREQCRVMMLNTRSMLLAEKQLSVGTVNASLISARENFSRGTQMPGSIYYSDTQSPQRRSGAQQRGYSINRTGSQGRRAYGDPPFGSYCDWRQRVCQYERTRIVINGVKTQ